MNGKSIASSTARWITIAKDQACFIWSSGRGSTTPPTQQVGNHLNTLQMHLMWSKHSTRLIQISQPPKFIERGHCLYVLLSFRTLISYLWFRLFFLESLFFFILQVPANQSTSPIPLLPPTSPSPSLFPQLLTHKPTPFTSSPAAEALPPP